MQVLAEGPLRNATSCPVYIANGYKFCTSAWGEERKTFNSGVCVSGIGHDGTTNEYYGVIKEILKLEWTRTTQKLVLFYCDWFDPSKHGMKVDSQFGIVEVRERRRYAKFDPFIFPETVTQVYYANHPESKGDKANWWVVIKTKPRGVVDERHNVEVAYQEEQSHVNPSIEDDPIDCLQDDQVVGEEVDMSSIQPFVKEDGYDLSDDEDEEIASEEEEELFDSDDSQDHCQTHDEDELQ